MPLPFLAGLGAALVSAGAAAVGTATAAGAAAVTAATGAAATAGGLATTAMAAAGGTAGTLAGAAGSIASAAGGAVAKGTLAGSLSSLSALAADTVSAAASKAMVSEAMKSAVVNTSRMVLSDSAKSAIKLAAKSSTKIPWKDIERGLKVAKQISDIKKSYDVHQLEMEQKRQQMYQQKQQYVQTNPGNVHKTPEELEQERQDKIMNDLLNIMLERELTNKDIQLALEKLIQNEIDMFNPDHQKLFNDFKQSVIEMTASFNSTEEQTSTDEIFSALNKLNVGDVFAFGLYPKNLADQFEPLEWQVLDKQADKMLVVTRYGIDSCDYNSDNSSITWEKCSLRQELNGGFLRGVFPKNELSFILEAVISNVPNPWYNTHSGSNTKDRVFLLSAEEVQKYFKSDSDRQCEPTRYAIEKGAYVGDGKHCTWWTRTAGDSNGTVVTLRSNGTIRKDGLYPSFHKGDDGKNCYRGVVRPAMWLKLKEM